MRDGKVSDQDKDLQAEVLRLVKDRRATFGQVKATVALKKEGEFWKKVIAVFEILSKDNQGDEQKHYDYGNFIIKQIFISLDDFLEIFSAIVNKGELAIPGAPKVPAEGNLQKDYMSAWHYHPSNDTILNLTWPANVFMLQVTDAFKAAPPGEPLVSLNHPLFDQGWAAFRTVFGFDVQSASYYMQNIVFVIPNFSAKIFQVKLGTSKVSLRVATNGLPYNELVAKVYAENPPRTFHTDTRFEGDEVEIPLEFSPNFYLIYLLSAKTGEVLDHRRFGVGWPSLTGDIIMEVPSENIEQIISRGESNQVEFKQEFPKNWEDFVKTVVAFANSEGGTIFLGVDDEGSIVGVKDTKIEDTMQNCLRSYLEVPIDAKISRHEIQNQTVVLVQVRKGTDKPYTLRNKGVYVRANGTSRIATRYELDELYGKRFPGTQAV